VFTNDFTAKLGIRLPIIGGAMYPSSNPELVAAVTRHGGIGVFQPISLTYVHGHDYREGIRLMQRLAGGPIGMNVITEKSARYYLERMRKWLDIALEEGVRFFVSSLGNPRWIVERVESAGGLVYHDVTERKWALKALDAGVHGLIAVNNRAGGHAGARDPRKLYDELVDLNAPLILAGGIGDASQFAEALEIGYLGVQIGTRLIATTECKAHPDYKQAIVSSTEDDIVLTDKISGVPVAVINTPYVRKTGATAGRIARRLLRHNRTKHWMRMYYSMLSFVKLKRGLQRSAVYRNYWQAGKSVGTIRNIEPVGEIMARFAAALPGAAPTA